MTAEPTVFVVDDDPGALRSLCWLIEQAELPVRAFRSGHEFLESYRAEDAGCLVLDLRMPEMDGLEVQDRLRERGIGLPVIFVTAYGSVPTCSRAFTAGAFHFLEKPVNDAVLLDHIQKALLRDVEQRRQGSAAEFGVRTARLTPAEKAVLDMLVAGKSLKEIAIVRNVTVQTIWKHRRSILQKMGVENDKELVRRATQSAYSPRP